MSVFVDDHMSIFFPKTYSHLHLVLQEYDIKMSCNDLETNSTREIAHLLISIVLTSIFQTSLANFRTAKSVSTVMNKLCVGFGGNREELKEKHTGKKVENR